MVADLDYLFEQIRAADIPFLAIGDGGNELGMGVIAEDLVKFSPKAADTGVPGRGGVAAVTAADLLVVANVSNWGATGVIAALSALLENPLVFPDPELEVRCIECSRQRRRRRWHVYGAGAGGRWHQCARMEGLIRSLRLTVQRTMGDSVNWQGHRGDWRAAQMTVRTISSRLQSIGLSLPPSNTPRGGYVPFTEGQRFAVRCRTGSQG